jgi:biotin synthase
MFARLGLKAMAITQTQAEVDAMRMPKGCVKLEAAE